MMTPPSVRRSFHQAPGAGGSGMYARPAPSSSGEDVRHTHTHTYTLGTALERQLNINLCANHLVISAQTVVLAINDPLN